MTLTIVEKFLLLILRQDSPKYKVSEMQRNAGIVAGILIDLQAHECITFRDRKIQVLRPTTHLSTAHQQVLELIAASSKERKLYTWYFKLSNKVRLYRYELLEHLKSQGFVKIEEKKTWFVRYKHAYLIKENEQRQLSHNLKQAVNQRYPDDESMVSLLVLVFMGRMYKLLAEEKSQIKELRRTLKDRFANHELAKALERCYRDFEAATSG